MYSEQQFYLFINVLVWNGSVTDKQLSRKVCTSFNNARVGVIISVSKLFSLQVLRAEPFIMKLEMLFSSLHDQN